MLGHNQKNKWENVFLTDVTRTSSRASGATIIRGKVSREKIEDYLRFLTHAGEMRVPIFAWGSLRKLSHFVARLSGEVTLTLEIV